MGHSLGAWTPYVRIDGITRDDADPYLASLEDVFSTALGVRYDLSRHLALTAQYENQDIDAEAGGSDSRAQAFVLQASLAF
jgi:hypothetical protein